MNAAREIRRAAWRLGVCGLLLLWILQSIFLNEGRLAWERQGQSWPGLSRWQQWQAAWSCGPRELWHTLTLVDRTALLLSLVLMGVTIALGVFR